MGQMIRTHYQVLGIPPTAPPEAVQQAYRKVIVRAACSSGPEAHVVRDELRLAREAFAVLMNPERRAAYDSTCGDLRAQSWPSQRGPLAFWPRHAA